MPAGFPARRHVRHWRTALMAALIAFALFHATAALAAETKSVENLEQTFAREKDARKRARLALEDRKSTRLNSSHIPLSRMPSSA